jgi:phage tail sheath protein FI
VFAINDARLRRRVQRGFERVLTVLHARGALAGRTTAEAFRVDVSAPQGGDLGRLIVELRVAPSLPMRFLTIRLVHGAGGVVEVQG